MNIQTLREQSSEFFNVKGDGVRRFGAYPTYSPMYIVLFSPDIKRPGREANHSHPFSTDVKNPDPCSSMSLI
jgi:hypothetical protein